MIVPIGPIHPALKEPIRLKLQTEGERVVKAEIEYGYVHRGIEKIIEGKTWQKGIYLSERVCGISSGIDSNSRRSRHHNFQFYIFHFQLL